MNRTIVALGLCVVVCLPIAAFAGGVGHWTELPRRNHPTAEGQFVVLKDGRVLQLGGFDASPFWGGGQLTTDCEIWDPRRPTDDWVECAPMPYPKAMFWAVTLPSGNVLVAGNFTVGLPDPFTSAVYETAKDRWHVIESGPEAPPHQLVNPHNIMKPQVLPDGTVLIAGGAYATGGLGATDESWLFTENASNPKKGQWSPTGRMSYAAVSAAVTTLSDGRVLFAGGLEDIRFNSYITSSQANVYDWTTKQWHAVDDMPACVGTDDAATVAPEWFFGGPDCNPGDADCVGNSVNPGSRWHAASAPLPGGDAIVAGGATWGADESDWWSYARTSVVRFHGSAETWEEVAPMNHWRNMARAVALPLGFVFMNGFFEESVAEIYDPWRDRWIDAGGYSDLPSCRITPPGEPCHLIDEYGGDLQRIDAFRVLQTCGYDYEYPGGACDRAFLWSP